MYKNYKMRLWSSKTLPIKATTVCDLYLAAISFKVVFLCSVTPLPVLLPHLVLQICTFTVDFKVAQKTNKSKSVSNGSNFNVEDHYRWVELGLRLWLKDQTASFSGPVCRLKTTHQVTQSMLDVLLNINEVVYLGFILQDQTANAELHCNILRHLRENIGLKWPELWHLSLCWCATTHGALKPTFFPAAQSLLSIRPIRQIWLLQLLPLP